MENGYGSGVPDPANAHEMPWENFLNETEMENFLNAEMENFLNDIQVETFPKESEGLTGFASNTTSVSNPSITLPPVAATAEKEFVHFCPPALTYFNWPSYGSSVPEYAAQMTGHDYLNSNMIVSDYQVDLNTTAGPPIMPGAPGPSFTLPPVAVPALEGLRRSAADKEARQSLVSCKKESKRPVGLNTTAGSDHSGVFTPSSMLGAPGPSITLPPAATKERLRSLVNFLRALGLPVERHSLPVDDLLKLPHDDLLKLPLYDVFKLALDDLLKLSMYDVLKLALDDLFKLSVDDVLKLALNDLLTLPLDDLLKLVKVVSDKDLFKFELPEPTMDNLKEQVLKRKPELGVDALKFMYKDEEGEMITITCDEDLHFCSKYFKSTLQQTSIRLSLVANDNPQSDCHKSSSHHSTKLQ